MDPNADGWFFESLPFPLPFFFRSFSSAHCNRRAIFNTPNSRQGLDQLDDGHFDCSPTKGIIPHHWVHASHHDDHENMTHENYRPKLYFLITVNTGWLMVMGIWWHLAIGRYSEREDSCNTMVEDVRIYWVGVPDELWPKSKLTRTLPNVYIYIVYYTDRVFYIENTIYYIEYII